LGKNLMMLLACFINTQKQAQRKALFCHKPIQCAFLKDDLIH